MRHLASLHGACFLVLVLALASAGCGGRDAAPSTGASEPSAPVAEQRFTESDRVALMEHHYTAAIQAHDALIRGKLPELRAELIRLASQPLAANAPASWRGPHDALLAAARTAAEATTIEAAGAGMARVTQLCGSCHQMLGQGPDYQQPQAAGADEPLKAEMLHRQWISERLWEGVTGPRDDAWKRGAEQLAKIELASEVAPAADAAAKEGALRQSGAAALAATTPEQRAEVYGRVLAQCASCHAPQP